MVRLAGGNNEKVATECPVAARYPPISRAGRSLGWPFVFGLLLFLIQEAGQIGEGAHGLAALFHGFGDGLFLFGLCGQALDGLGMGGLSVSATAAALVATSTAATAATAAIGTRGAIDAAAVGGSRDGIALVRLRRALGAGRPVLRGTVLRWAGRALPALRPFARLRWPLGAGGDGGERNSAAGLIDIDDPD